MGATIKESRVMHALVVKQVLTEGDERKSVYHPTKVKRDLGGVPRSDARGAP